MHNNLSFIIYYSYPSIIKFYTFRQREAKNVTQKRKARDRTDPWSKIGDFVHVHRYELKANKKNYTLTFIDTPRDVRTEN